MNADAARSAFVLHVRLLGFLLTFVWTLHALVVFVSACGAHVLESPWAARLVVAASGAAALSVAFWVRPWPMDKGPRGHVAADRLARMISIIAIACFLVLVPLALALPMMAYDALGYRLPTVAQWLDAGRVAWVVSDDAVRNGYPLGLEAIGATLAVAFHHMPWVAAASLPVVALGALSLVAFAEFLGLRASLGRAAGAAFVLSPMVLLNAPTGYVDAGFAGATVAFVVFAALWSSGGHAPRDDKTLAAAFGMAGALVLAIKGTGLVFVGLVTPLAFFRAHRRNARFVSSSRWFLPALSGGAFWVVRNVVHTGNPLWPVEVRVFRHVIFAGTFRLEQAIDIAHNTPALLAHAPSFARPFLAWLQLRGPAIAFDDRLAGLGWTWVGMALPAMGAVLLHAFVKRHRLGDAARTRADNLVFVIFATALCFLAQPMPWWARYTVWLWGAGALSLADVADRNLERAPRAVTLLMALYLGVVSVEASVALFHSNKVIVSLFQGTPVTSLLDVRKSSSVRAWVRPSFWSWGVDRGPEVCRSPWRFGTDNTLVDGLMAQLRPRPRVRILDDRDWSRMKAEWKRTRCAGLLVLRGSPALVQASKDATVLVQRIEAFDPLYLIRVRAREKHP